MCERECVRERVSVCVCVYVCERERDRDRDREGRQILEGLQSVGLPLECPPPERPGLVHVWGLECVCERERDGESVCVRERVCVCVCVRERQRQRQRQNACVCRVWGAGVRVKTGVSGLGFRV